jgi:nucleotide-binding universal stress UspA family protein
MTSVSKILVPLDFSSHSKQAIRLGADLAARYGAKLHLLHVFEPFSHVLPGDGISAAQDQQELVLNELEAQLTRARRLATTLGASQTETLLMQGRPVSEILRIAPGYDLIIMGTHGRGAIKRLLMGSIAQRIVQSARCPVLTIRSAS